MALIETGKAIRRISEVLVSRIAEYVKRNSGIELQVSVGRPEKIEGATSSGKRLNLFLYEAPFDPSLKNLSLDEGKPAPLWLVLKYLLTAFDDGGESDTEQAHEYLGEGIRALQELSFLPLISSSSDALQDNPEVLKITFEEAPAELISKLMQGPDDKYRFSMCFQVRPIMIATAELPSYSLMVGYDYTQNKVREDEERGVLIDVIPTMGIGPVIHSISMIRFEPDETVALYGENLNVKDLKVRLGPVELPVTSQRPDKVEFFTNGIIKGGKALSAGNHPVCVRQNLPGGKTRSSNYLAGNLIPILNNVTVTGVLQKVLDASINTHVIKGKLKLTGLLLGTHEDFILAAFFRNGSVKKMFEIALDPPAGPPPPGPIQTELELEIKKKDQVLPGTYRLILRVNSQQAKNSPEVILDVP